ncbi:MAG: class I SAM-dependent methyltransferase [bacterium]|nr:class I SAM-dependent methyltransferase [bacterium]
MRDKETEDYYRLRATEYEQIYFREIPERRKEIDDEAERLRALVAGKTVLEMACGTGYWTKVMSETAAHVTASDLWPEMVAETRKKQFGGPVELVVADMFAHPFPERAFDVVAVGFWFSHQPKQEYDKFFEVVRRPLKPGGKIWLIENNPPAEGTHHEFVRKDEFGNSFKRRYLENGEQHVILKNYFEEGGLRSIFEPEFSIESMVYKKYYWSVVLRVNNL